MAENITPFNYDTPFTPARPRKKRKNKPGLHATTNQTQPSEALHRMRQYLLQGDWMLECKQLLRESVSLLQASSPEVLCLGLGSPASSRDARAQLAFLLEACDEMSLDYSKVSAYDPVFTPEDQQLLDDLEVQRLTENRGAAYPFDTPTIVFMPHCDLQLYENLLRENWSRERLPNLLLIANRLSEYLDNHPSHKFSADFPCISQLAPLISSHPLPQCPTQTTAFNNIALQYIPSGSLETLGSGFWDLPRLAGGAETKT